MRVGLVLAAGGSVGVAYHGAVMAALEEVTGWDPRRAELMVGTSAGSITAAVLRAGLPASDLVRFTENRPLSVEGTRLASLGRPHRPRVSPRDLLAFRPVGDPLGILRAALRPCRSSLAGLLAAALPRGGVSTSAISEGLNAVYGGRWPKRGLWICAFELRRGMRVVFGRPGSPPAQVGDAVAASSAIPGYFRPVVIGGARYVDGGVHSMVNLDLLADQPLDLVVVSSPLSQARSLPDLAPYSLLRQPLRTQLRREVAHLRSLGVPVVAIQPTSAVARSMGLNPMQARRRFEVSRATTEAVRAWLRDDVEGRRLARLLGQAASGPLARSQGLGA